MSDDTFMFPAPAAATVLVAITATAAARAAASRAAAGFAGRPKTRYLMGGVLAWPLFFFLTAVVLYLDSWYAKSEKK